MEGRGSGKPTRYLIYYYGVLQTLHFVGLVILLLGDTEQAMASLSPGLTGDAATAMMASSYMDILLSAPLGIASVVGFLARQGWYRSLLRLSLGFAMGSAFVYTYVLIAFGLWAWNAANLAIMAAFTPMVWLYLREFLGKNT